MIIIKFLNGVPYMQCSVIHRGEKSKLLAKGIFEEDTLELTVAMEEGYFLVAKWVDQFGGYHEIEIGQIGTEKTIDIDVGVC